MLRGNSCIAAGIPISRSVIGWAFSVGLVYGARGSSPIRRTSSSYCALCLGTMAYKGLREGFPEVKFANADSYGKFSFSA